MQEPIDQLFLMRSNFGKVLPYKLPINRDALHHFSGLATFFLYLPLSEEHRKIPFHTIERFSKRSGILVTLSRYILIGRFNSFRFLDKIAIDGFRLLFQLSKTGGVRLECSFEFFPLSLKRVPQKCESLQLFRAQRRRHLRTARRLFRLPLQILEVRLNLDKERIHTHEVLAR